MGAPAEAIRSFLRAIETRRILAVPRHVKNDIIELRRVFPDDNEFAQALRAVTSQLRNLHPEAGVSLGHGLKDWRRIKFSSGASRHADLRIIFRFRGSRMELRAFGHRRDPESIYLRAVARRKR